MNKLKAKITEIESSGELSLISLLCNNTSFFALIINQKDDFIRPGNPVYMIFKETEVSIIKGSAEHLSIRNRFNTEIQQINKSKLLTELILNFYGFPIQSIITTGSCNRLNLQVGEKVTALLKTNELMLMRYD